MLFTYYENTLDHTLGWSKMRNTTIHLPQLYLKLIDEIICDKNIPCTSEFIRIAIRRLLKRDLNLLSSTKIGKTSGEIQAFKEKQRRAKMQKSLDHFRLMYELNPAMQKYLPKKLKPTQSKQARIDSFWK